MRGGRASKIGKQWFLPPPPDFSSSLPSFHISSLNKVACAHLLPTATSGSPRLIVIWLTFTSLASLLAWRHCLWREGRLPLLSQPLMALQQPACLYSRKHTKEKVWGFLLSLRSGEMQCVGCLCPFYDSFSICLPDRSSNVCPSTCR